MRAKQPDLAFGAEGVPVLADAAEHASIDLHAIGVQRDEACRTGCALGRRQRAVAKVESMATCERRAAQVELAADVCADEVHNLERAVGQIEAVTRLEACGGGDARDHATAEPDLGGARPNQVDRLVEEAVVGDQWHQ